MVLATTHLDEIVMRYTHFFKVFLHKINITDQNIEDMVGTIYQMSDLTKYKIL